MLKRGTHFVMPGPFSLKATALGHGWHECAPVLWCEAADCLQVIERVGVQPLRLSLQVGPPGAREVRVTLTVEGENVSDDVLSLARSRAATMLRSDLDLSEFYAVADAHPQLAVLRPLGAGRLLRSASMTENILKTMCSTNVNWTQAIKMINRVAQLGPCLKHFRNLNAWPTTREILTAGEDYLLNVARLGYRTPFILKFCRDVEQGKFDPQELDTLASSAAPTDDLYDRLLSLGGIGPSSAGFLLSLLGRFDRMSIDSATLSFVGDRYFSGRKPTPKQVQAVYEPYGRWKNLVWWFEHWLTWETAKEMVDGLQKPSPRRRVSAGTRAALR